jgi:hypothetical protein
MKSKILVGFIMSILLITGTLAQWNKHTVDAGKYNKILNDSSGTPHIFYFQSYCLRHAKWTGSGWFFEPILSNISSPYWDAFDAIYSRNGTWHLCWMVSTGYDMHYTYNIGNIWKDTIIKPFNYGYEQSLSIALDTFNFPHIVSYHGMSQRLEHRWYVSGPTAHWMCDTIDMNTDIRRPKIVIDSLNRIYVAYYASGHLKLAYYDGTQWGTHFVDILNDVGEFCDLKLDKNGKVCISYYDATNGDLKYAVGTSLGK